MQEFSLYFTHMLAFNAYGYAFKHVPVKIFWLLDNKKGRVVKERLKQRNINTTPIREGGLEARKRKLKKRF
jgi:hypothetical protein